MLSGIAVKLSLSSEVMGAVFLHLLGSSLMQQESLASSGSGEVREGCSAQAGTSFLLVRDFGGLGVRVCVISQSIREFGDVVTGETFNSFLSSRECITFVVVYSLIVLQAKNGFPA